MNEVFHESKTWIGTFISLKICRRFDYAGIGLTMRKTNYLMNFNKRKENVGCVIILIRLQYSIMYFLIFPFSHTVKSVPVKTRKKRGSFIPCPKPLKKILVIDSDFDTTKFRVVLKELSSKNMSCWVFCLYPLLSFENNYYILVLKLRKCF